jgi:aldehyde:ferredoxin oxidoreductase
MSKLGGYAGNILKVDLTTKSITSAPLSPELAAKFLGGAGLNARLAYDCIPAHTPAFSPQNTLVFGAGPLVGTLAPGAGKTNITAKSPLGKFMGSSGSGHMGAVKFAGYDHVLVTGKADSPVYLVIADEVEIREADHLWGKDTWETTDVIWRELGREYAVASIGPAGENLVADAAIIANKYSAFGTTGMGAVMGSKNLKAIAAYGSQGITVAEPKRFMELVNGLCKEMLNFPFIQVLRDLGTLINFENLVTGNTQGSGAIAYKNCQQVAD